MQFFDKAQIKANFNQANQSYNSSAILQKIVARNLVALAKKDIASANKILDLGCGTGFIANQILEKDKTIFQLDIAYKMLQANNGDIKINGDIELLPFRKNSFDLALSSLSFQWLNQLETSIAEVMKVIEDNGSFYFSVIADGSLQELKQSCQACDVELSINDFITKEALKIILDEHNFDYQITSEEIVLEYDDLYLLLKSIKSIGASYSKNREYIGKNQFAKLASFYLKNFNLKYRVFATWRVLYVVIKNKFKNV